MRSRFLLLKALSCFESATALQATSFVARGDQSAKGAHSLGRKITGMGFDLQELPQRSAQQGTQTAQAGKKRMRRKRHVCNPAFLLEPYYDDTSRTGVLCKIALFCHGRSLMPEWKLPQVRACK
jgi:hypothetical protein